MRRLAHKGYAVYDQLKNKGQYLMATNVLLWITGLQWCA